MVPSAIVGVAFLVGVVGGMLIGILMSYTHSYEEGYDQGMNDMLDLIRQFEEEYRTSEE